MVTTSDVPDGAFDGVVYVTLTGLEGSTAEMPLVNSQPTNFGVKTVDTFSIRAADIGAINSVIIRIVSPLMHTPSDYQSSVLSRTLNLQCVIASGPCGL